MNWKIKWICLVHGGGGKCLGCCWAALYAIVLAYDGGSLTGIIFVGDVEWTAFPLIMGCEIGDGFNTGGVVGGVLFCCNFEFVVVLVEMWGWI